jgi:hypothetical protein
MSSSKEFLREESDEEEEEARKTWQKELQKYGRRLTKEERKKIQLLEKEGEEKRAKKRKLSPEEKKTLQDKLQQMMSSGNPHASVVQNTSESQQKHHVTPQKEEPPPRSTTTTASAATPNARATTSLKIVPIKNTSQEQAPEFNGPEHLPKPPFRMVIAAQSFSGKSTLIMNMITRPEFGYQEYFGDRIFIFSNSFHTDPIWSSVSPGIRRRATAGWSETKFKELWDKQAERIKKEGKKTPKNSMLILIDDCVDNLAHTSGLTVIDSAFMRIRHANCSIIVTTQEYKRIPKTVRMNCSDFIAFHITNNTEKKQIAEEQNAGLGPKMWLQVAEKVWETPYAFIYIKHTEPRIQYRFFSSFENMISLGSNPE